MKVYQVMNRDKEFWQTVKYFRSKGEAAAWLLKQLSGRRVTLHGEIYTLWSKYNRAIPIKLSEWTIKEIVTVN